MNQLSITLHNIDPVISQKLVEKANRDGLSLNKTAQKLLGDALGVSKVKTKKKRDLSWLYGSWTKKEAEEFDKATEVFERIDPDDWK